MLSLVSRSARLARFFDLVLALLWVGEREVQELAGEQAGSGACRELTEVL